MPETYKKRTLFYILTSLFLLGPIVGFCGSTFTSNGGGIIVNWSNPLSWTGGPVGTTPGVGDNVIIAAGNPITVDVVSSCYNLTVNATGTITNNSTLTVAGILNLSAATSTLTQGNGSGLSLSYNVSGTGVLNASASNNTVTYTLNSTIIYNASSYYNLTLSSSSAVYSFAANQTVASNFKANAGSRISGLNGKILTLGGNYTDVNNGTYTTSLSVIFNGGAGVTQTVTASSPTQLQNVTIANSGTATVSLLNQLNVNGDLTFNAASGTLDAGAGNYWIVIYGNWVNNGGTFKPRSGVVDFAPMGAVAKTVGKIGGTETFYNFYKQNNGITNLSSSISVTGSIFLFAGTVNSSSFNIAANCNWTNNGCTFNGGTGTVTFNAAGATLFVSKTPGPETFSNVTKTGSSALNMQSAINCSGNLTISAGAIDVNGSNFGISVGGNLTIAGSITVRTGTVTLNGLASQTLSGTQTFYNLAINNTGGANFASAGFSVSNLCTLNGTGAQTLNGVGCTFHDLSSATVAGTSVTAGTWTITHSLIPTAGTLTGSGGNIILQSNAASTAYLVNGAGTLAGTFKVQHWVPNPGQGNWADIGTTVSNNTINDWDQQIFISGVDGRNGTACCPSFYSFTIYDEPAASSNYVTAGTIGTPITPGVGYTLWLADTYSPASWVAKSITSDGTPNMGNITSPSLTYTAGSADPGENHISNPFASHITWDASGTNITKSGNVDLSTIYVISNGNYVSHGNGFDLPGGQGFIVYSTAAGSNNITFTQACKNTSTTSAFDFREAAPYNLKLKLSTPALPEFFHEVTVNFDENASMGFETSYDARFIPSPEKKAPGLCMVENGTRLTRNTFNSSAYETVTIPVKCIIGQDGTYKLESFGAYSMTEYSCVLLEDVQTHQITDLKKISELDFSAKTTDNPNRFILHLTRQSTTCEQILASTKPADLFYSDNQVTIIPQEGMASVAFDLDQSTNTTISIYNTLGQKVVSDINLVAFKDKTTIDLPSDASGIYIITVNLGGNHMVTKKIYVSR